MAAQQTPPGGITFPPHVQDRIREIAESAPPLTPEQQAVIRGCCTRPRPAAEPEAARAA